jgi:hypothetical protein
MRVIAVLIGLAVFMSLAIPGFGNDKVGVREKSNHKDIEREDIYSEYSALIESLKKSGVDVHEGFKENVLKFLNSDEKVSLIGFQPSNVGLSWYLYDLVFLRKDLIFVSYEDGQMYGGDLLISVKYSDNKVISMKTLWNSASEK